ncbi:MAG: serine/threonine-protein phosphatase [Candidatus Dactylopiibacterium sp.]|nr:serine/threonine-protein phosphatase [Candidatus Dactylopiibacterium sp.]
MKFTIYQESRPGARPNNQDRVAYSYTRESLLLVVADGMGGHLHGEIAAQIAVQYVVEAFQRAARPLVQDEAMFLSRCLGNAHAAIQDYAFDKNLPEAPRTTIVACLIQKSVAFWAHAGDSRLYLLRRGRIAQQTKDHSRLQMMLDQGLIDEEAAARHPARNRIYSCLGGSHSPQIEFSSPVPLFADDIVAICTDGVWGNLASEDFNTHLAGTNILDSTPGLMDQAERQGGASCDNLTILTMHWHDDYAEAQGPAISTEAMPADGITTRMEGFARPRPGESGGLTDADIEQAISEINLAIQKYSRFDPGK